MKTKLLLLSILLLIAVQVKANSAKAVFKTENGTRMIVYVNGHRVNANPMMTVVTDRLYPGKHHVTIKVLGNHQVKSIHQPIHLKKNHRTKYLIKNNRRRTSPSLLKVQEEPMFERPLNPYVTDRNAVIRNGRVYGKNFDRNHRHAENLLNLRRFMLGMDNQRFDFEKVDYAKAMLTQKQLFAGDLADILNTISFDSNKLEVAMFAYGNVIDKENIYVVNNSFTFRSSKKKFERFIHDGSRF